MPEKAKPPVSASAQDEPAKINQQEEQTKTVKKVAECASEAFLPGGSNYLKGDLKQGAIHTVAAFGAAMVIGPVGWVVAIADSLSKSQTGKHLHEHLGFFTKPAESTSAPQA
jgi:hypothetical protein